MPISKPPKATSAPILDPMHTMPRIPIAVDCWFPTGEKLTPKILQFKIKDDAGDIFTINRIRTLQCTRSFYFGSEVLEYHCEIEYLYTKRDVIIYFFLKFVKWEIVFLT